MKKGGGKVVFFSSVGLSSIYPTLLTYFCFPDHIKVEAAEAEI